MSGPTVWGEETMPLSEDEQRQLDQMARALAREDPEFAWYLDGGQPRRVMIAAGVLGVGMILLLVRVVTAQSALMIGAIISVAAILAIVAALAVYLLS